MPNTLQYAAEKLSDRALGYGIYGETVDGDDPIAMYKAMKEARERALNGEGATLIEAITHRMTYILQMMMIHIVRKEEKH